MIRMFNDNEKNFCKKQIERMKKEIKHFDYLCRYYKMMIDEGLYMNYLEKVDEFKATYNQILGELKTNYEKINLLNSQIINGVEVIEEKTPIGVG